MQQPGMIYLIIFIAVLLISIGRVTAIENEPKDYNGKDLFREEN